jgi:hypothetical protein
MRLDDSELLWQNFEKFKVNENEYDFTNATAEEIAEVYRLLKPDDEVIVSANNNSN